MVQELQNFRAKYPMYEDMDDTTLAAKLAEKYPDAYGDLPAKVGAAGKKLAAPPPPEPTDYTGIPAENLTQAWKGTPQGMAEVIREQAVPFARTTTPYVGAMIGAGLGAGATPILGPAAPVIGGALGYSITKQTFEPPKTAEEAFTRVPGELATGATAEMGGQALGSLIERYGVPAAQKISNVVKASMQKLRPKGAPPQLYYDEAETAVKEIIANQGALNLRDEAGNAVTGLPKTVPQFEQAIHQTKQIVFNRYDALAREAGDQGLNVSLEPVAKQLDAFADEAVNRTMTPNLAKYARERAAALREQGAFNPSQAQDAVTKANSAAKLKARYDKRGVASPDLTQQATVDALEANVLRRELDNVVSGATGESYQGLKDTYGALRSIEDDVRRRAAVQARQNVKGFFDIGEFYSGAELARFLVTADPTALAMSIGAKTPGMLAKYLNAPDRYVKNMFGDVERIMASPEFQASVPKPEVTAPPTGGREQWSVRQPPTGAGPEVIIPQTGARYVLTAEGKLIPVPPMREGTFSPGPIMGESGQPLITPTVGGQAPPTTGLGMPDVNIGPPAWQAPQLVTRPGTAPESAKVGEPLIRRGEPTGRAVIPARIGGVQGEIRLGKGGNTIEFVPLSEAESRFGLKPGWAYSGEGRGTANVPEVTSGPKIAPIDQQVKLSGSGYYDKASDTIYLSPDISPYYRQQHIDHYLGDRLYEKFMTQEEREIAQKLGDTTWGKGGGHPMSGFSQYYSVYKKQGNFKGLNDREINNLIRKYDKFSGGGQPASLSLESIRNAFSSIQKSKGLSSIDHISIADIADQLGVSAEQIKPIIQKALASGEVAGSDMSWTLGSANTPQRIKDATLNLRVGKISDIIFR